MRRQPAFIMAINMLTLLVVYMLTRWMFYYKNISSFPDVTLSEMMTICRGGLRFDVSALCYINLLYIVLQVLPLRARHTARYQRVAKIIFLCTNAIGIAVNVADIAYFEFGGRRTTATIFAEYGGESNLGLILLHSITTYWQAWLFGIAMIAATVMLYYNPYGKPSTNSNAATTPDTSATHSSRTLPYYVLHSALFIIVMTLAIGGARGGLRMKMHPMRQLEANLYCNKPQEAAIVLNTPFTIITTAHRTGYADPGFMPAESLDSIFCPIHNASPDTAQMRKLNVIVFLLESFSMEFVGFYNNGQGYTPFLDSLLAQSYSFRWGFANGIRSVDCMPAAFAGIPRYINPYCYYHYSNNTLQALPAMLAREGYTTAFFHGAPNTTLGFQSFTNSIGFQQYYGMDEYPDKDDFDGTWAIFDEPYLQYFAHKTDEIARSNKPYFLTVFTASSHDPFAIPQQHRNTFNRSTHPMHNAISYSDYALRRYFETLHELHTPLDSTIFVFTADHTGRIINPDYNNEMGHTLIPIFFYTPGGQLTAQCDSTHLIQQTDITPTLLGLLNYQQPYFSFGKDVFAQQPKPNYVFNDINGHSMYYLDDLMIEYNQDKLYAIYRYQTDTSLKHNLLLEADSAGAPPAERFPQLPFMQQQMEAIIQQYVTRMKENRLCAQ